MMRITLPRSKSSSGIAYYCSGDGPPIVLIHGVGLRADSWYLQIKLLEKTNTVIALDLPGHGESVQSNNNLSSLAAFTTQLQVFADEIISQPFVLIGHSMGAMIAIDFAARHPEQCLGVAALNAIYKRTYKASIEVKERAALLHKSKKNDISSITIARWFGSEPNQEMAELCRTWLNECNIDSYSAAYNVFAEENGPSETMLASLSMPILFLTGEIDKNSTAEMTKAMALQCKQGSAAIIENAGHIAQLTHPTKVNEMLRLFIATCEN